MWPKLLFVFRLWNNYLILSTCILQHLRNIYTATTSRLALKHWFNVTATCVFQHLRNISIATISDSTFQTVIQYYRLPYSSRCEISGPISWGVARSLLHSILTTFNHVQLICSLPLLFLWSTDLILATCAPQQPRSIFKRRYRAVGRTPNWWKLINICGWQRHLSITDEVVRMTQTMPYTASYSQNLWLSLLYVMCDVIYLSYGTNFQILTNTVYRMIQLGSFYCTFSVDVRPGSTQRVQPTHKLYVYKLVLPKLINNNRLREIWKTRVSGKEELRSRKYGDT